MDEPAPGMSFKWFSDKGWCEEQPIHTSNFYYQIRRLWKMVCEIMEPAHSVFTKKSEIVQLSFDVPVSCPSKKAPSFVNGFSETAIRIMLYGFQVEITPVGVAGIMLGCL